jgi:RNA recognition motif-containing protein
VNVSIPTDRNDGRPRGFAFVEMSTPEQAEAAMERFNGYELGGRPLRVNEAGQRPPRPPSFGAGGGGFGAGGGDRPAFRPKPKGSRRNLRARKRSIW